LENLFFNWTGVPSFFFPEEFRAAVKNSNPLQSMNYAHFRTSHSVLQIIPPAMICSLDFFSKILPTFTLQPNNPISYLIDPFPIFCKATNPITQLFSVSAGLHLLGLTQGGRPAA
jgi:hypothetical protein